MPPQIPLLLHSATTPMNRPPSIPPRPAMQRAVAPSRLSYPRLATCDVGYYAGPPCPAASAPVVSVASIEAQSSGAASAASFELEEKVLRTLATVQAQWEEERLARESRQKARAAALEARAVAEAAAAAKAEEARQAAIAEQRRKEAAAAAAAEEARLLAAAEEAKFRAEEQKLEEERQKLAARQREHEERRRAHELRSPPPVGGFNFPIAHPVLHGGGGSGNAVPVVLPTPAQLESQRSFQELTGVANVSQIGELLSLLNHDLDRAIAVFFSEDPPSMAAALDKARSIQQNAKQQQQQQQQQQQPSQYASQPQQQQGSVQPVAQPLQPVQPAQPQYGYQQYMQQHQHAQAAPVGVAGVGQIAPVRDVAQVVQPSWSGSQVKVMLPDGSPLVVPCTGSDTLWTLYERCSGALQSRPAWANKPIKFVQIAFPNAAFPEDKFDTNIANVFQACPPISQGTLRVELAR